jgi:hypothetical protein
MILVSESLYRNGDEHEKRKSGISCHGKNWGG